MDEKTPPRPAHHQPGFDERDSYLDREFEDLPSWWRENATIFDEHRMRPYRPPTFCDGSYVPPLIDETEDEFGVEVRIRKRITSTTEEEGNWEVLVDGTVAARFKRERNEEGRSVYRISRDAFVKRISNAVES